MIRSIVKIAVLLIAGVLFPFPSAFAVVLTSDTVWKGEVVLSESVLIPSGVTLTIHPGTTINVLPLESTRTDPEYLSDLTEITVRGTLKAEGTGKGLITFRLMPGRTGAWAGILLDGGTGLLASCRVQDADTGLYVFSGKLTLRESFITKNSYGIVAQGEGTTVSLARSSITDNEYGLVALQGAAVVRDGSIVRNNRKKDSFDRIAKQYSFAKEYHSSENRDEAMRQYRSDVLRGDTTWQGKISVDGVIRVPEGSRLIVLPGSVVEFKRRDTNGDGIGENGLLIQGLFIAKGTRDRPIIFRSAEKRRRMGDWDGINIMNSDGAQNLIEFCQIEDAYRGVHFHFSNVAIRESVLRNNYRGVQFQESIADASGNYITGNKTGVQARDSEVVFFGNTLSGNYTGSHFFRDGLTARDNTIVNNLREGMRVREGVPTVEQNLFDGNRIGLTVSSAAFASISRNVVSGNLETGFAVKSAERIELAGNMILGNGLNGVNILDSRGSIEGNVFSGNGERGIGVRSFDGVITGNDFVKNGLYALGVEGPADVAAPSNWWGTAEIEKVISDKQDDPAKGRVRYAPVADAPLPFLWPLGEIRTDITWQGDVRVDGTVAVQPGATLSIAPGARVLFSKDAGLSVSGAIKAVGRPGEEVTFTAREGSGGSWNEIFLDHANGSVFSYCTFERGTWGIHSHFTKLTVSDCLFRNNEGGIRFQSGPVEVRHSLFTGNTIGLRSFRGSALLSDNVITGNEVGIFIREKGSGVIIRGNDVFANSSHNIKSGDFNDEDVDARGNYWGAGDPAETFFDGRKESGTGKVLFEPYRTKPYRGNDEKTR